jgi:4-oxalocrotonate tautomerase
MLMIVANTQVTDCASRSSPAHINRKSLTPLARIDLPAGKPPEYGRAVAVHNAMIATLNAPKDDRFHVISEHTRDTLLIDPTYLIYLGVERSADALIIKLTLNEVRTVEVRKAFYPTVVRGSWTPLQRLFRFYRR